MPISGGTKIFLGFFNFIKNYSFGVESFNFLGSPSMSKFRIV